MPRIAGNNVCKQCPANSPISPGVGEAGVNIEWCINRSGTLRFDITNNRIRGSKRVFFRTVHGRKKNTNKGSRCPNFMFPNHENNQTRTITGHEE